MENNLVIYVIENMCDSVYGFKKYEMKILEDYTKHLHQLSLSGQIMNEDGFLPF